MSKSWSTSEKRKRSTGVEAVRRQRNATLNSYLIAEIATYLDVTTTSATNSRCSGGSDVMNLCIAVGTHIADVVRQVYLRDNELYLIHSLRLGLPPKMPSRRNRLEDFVYRIRREEAQKRRCHSKCNIQQWMKVNRDWKGRIDVDTYRGIAPGKSDGNLLTRLEFPLHVGMHPWFQFHVMLRWKSKGPYVVYAGALFQPAEIFMQRHYGIYPGDLVLTAAGHELTGMSIHYVRQMLDDHCSTSTDAWAELVFMRDPNVLFSNPVVASAYGLVDVVKFLVEERGIDVNDDSGFGGNLESSVPTSLLCVSFDSSPDLETFRYLLTVPGIDCMAPVGGNEIMDSGHFSQSGLLFLACACRNRNMTLDDFKALIHHSSVDVNRPTTATVLFSTPLERVVYSGERRDIKLQLVQTLLQAGADPRGIEPPNRPDGYYAPVDQVSLWIDAQPRRQVWKDILEVLKVALASCTSDH